MFNYQIYGLSIQSEVLLPAGQESLEEPSNLNEKLFFEVDLSKPKLPPPSMEGDYALVSPDKRHVYLNRLIGRYIISPDSKYVRYHPFEGCDPSVAPGYFVGVVLPYILQLRGYIPLHGSGVVINKKVWGILAGPGVGKSTLQTEFIKQGYTFFSDDVISLQVTENVIAFPGYPALKLERVPRSNLPDEIITGTYFLPDGATKSVYSLSSEVVQKKPLPLGGLVLLDPIFTETEEIINISDVKRTDAVISLLTNTFTLGLTNIELQQNYINIFTTKEFMDIPIWRARYPRNLNKLSELCHTLLNLIKKQN